MYEFTIEICRATFNWKSLAVIEGAVLLQHRRDYSRKWQKLQPSSASSQSNTRVRFDELGWLSLSEPADGERSRRDPLCSLSLSALRPHSTRQRLA
jgi:hypothetical protein